MGRFLRHTSGVPLALHGHLDKQTCTAGMVVISVPLAEYASGTLMT